MYPRMDMDVDNYTKRDEHGPVSVSSIHMTIVFRAV